jgi:hypothetical protein
MKKISKELELCLMIRINSTRKSFVKGMVKEKIWKEKTIKELSQRSKISIKN